MGLYMKFGDIKGDATEANHKNWIVLDSIQFGITRSVKARVGGSAIREASQPSVSDLTLTKPFDVSSGGLFTEALTASTGKLVQIDLTSTSKEAEVLLKIKLTDTLFANYQVSTGGDRPMESLSLNFTKIETTFSPVGGQPASVGYNLAEAKMT